MSLYVIAVIKCRGKLFFRPPIGPSQIQPDAASVAFETPLTVRVPFMMAWRASLHALKSYTGRDMAMEDVKLSEGRADGTRQTK